MCSYLLNKVCRLTTAQRDHQFLRIGSDTTRTHGLRILNTGKDKRNGEAKTSHEIRWHASEDFPFLTASSKSTTLRINTYSAAHKLGITGNVVPDHIEVHMLRTCFSSSSKNRSLCPAMLYPSTRCKRHTACHLAFVGFSGRLMLVLRKRWD